MQLDEQCIGKTIRLHGYDPCYRQLAQGNGYTLHVTSWVTFIVHQKYVKSLGKISLFTGAKVYDTDYFFVLQGKKLGE